MKKDLLIDVGSRGPLAAVAEDQPSSSTELESVPAVLSFDVEEHHTIEAAAGLEIGPDLTQHYHERMKVATEWLLELLHERQVRATFFVVGRIAEKNPRLVRSIHDAGHEVASHSWDHRRLHLLDPEAFRNDLRLSKEVLEEAIGERSSGIALPPSAVVRQTAWALDILAEMGFLYDSSIYPVHHDRYGVPDAPTEPFLARCTGDEILEIPPATLQLGGLNVPVGGRVLSALAVFSHEACPSPVT